MIRVQFGRDRYIDHEAMFYWCREYLGSNGNWCYPSDKERWGMDIHFGKPCFYFKNSKDAMMFKLRWA